jgi:hypothetical protein
MTRIIIEIMVEVLSILGIATKEVKQNRISKYPPYKVVAVDWTTFRKIWEEADGKDRDGRCAEEAGQTDSWRGLDEHCTKPESYARCGRESGVGRR